MENKELTLGEKRVRIEFNPSAESAVDVIKNKTADLINIINKCPTEDGEARRLISLAMTSYEEACMWAVKAITWKN